MENSDKHRYLPILIDLFEKKVLVVGAGNVATRKIETLLNYNCYITVISPFISKKIQEYEKKALLNVIKRKYLVGDADSFDIVFSAIDDKETQLLIYNDCFKNKIPLNVADVPELCSFIMPATVKRGFLTISIASQGKAPFLVKDIKDKIKIYFPKIYSDYALLSAEFREKLIKEYSLNETEKFEIINTFLNKDFCSIILSSGIEKARKIMYELFIGKNE